MGEVTILGGAGYGMDDQEFMDALDFENAWHIHLDEPRAAHLRELEAAGRRVWPTMSTHDEPLMFTINVWSADHRLLAQSNPAPYPAEDEQIREMFDQAARRLVNDPRY
ncbi:hypothetical protein E7T09_04135 [Deinococcus sp. KSM4-11]|uniref:hypothetical protein n=1 Tax=Deinococcus sp. KSM4-11 TaxID=2568654 RepID=UPI0010A384DB|nr:hypothetical protein [Deinococcus sp. KSM4-11]THF88403.1 hypothetical protein E7T09_04135 [Deinococcus sp. KSM4-11]